MNVKRLHLDRLILFRELENHFQPGCWGFCAAQRVYIHVKHEMRVPLYALFFIKGRIWKIVETEWSPHVHTMRLTFHRVARPYRAIDLSSTVDMTEIN